MRVLYLTEERISFSEPLVRGGAIHVRNVVKGLRERGHDVFLLDWNQLPEGKNHYSVSPTTRFVDGPLRSLGRAIQLGCRRDVDVIVSKTRKTYLPGLIAAASLGVPHVVHVGSSLDSSVTGGTLDTISMKTRLRPPHSMYLAVGSNISNQLQALGISQNRIRDVGNAVDVDRFSPDRCPIPGADVRRTLNTVNGPIICFVGGLYDYKGVYDLAAAVKECEHDVTALVAGDGPERAELETRLGSRGRFLGPVPYDDIPAIYHASDLFVLPSHTEGIPRVILEAQATATPVVATNVGSVPDVVGNGETGLLCDPKTPKALAHAISEALDDPPLRDRLRKAGRQSVVESYNWTSMYDRYDRYLRKAVAKTR